MKVFFSIHLEEFLIESLFFLKQSVVLYCECLFFPTQIANRSAHIFDGNFAAISYLNIWFIGGYFLMLY